MLNQPLDRAIAGDSSHRRSLSHGAAGGRGGGVAPGPDLSVGRSYFALVPLPSGDLLAPGGILPGPGYTNRVDIFSLAGRSFSETDRHAGIRTAISPRRCGSATARY